MPSQTEASAPPLASELLAGRYQTHEALGRGGLACVYRATDLATGKQVALKRLAVEKTAPQRASAAALFEREFHTLAQLRHPHVIEVYDYGLSAEQDPYYTMELLDGGDLRDLAPLPWREVCSLFFDVCSSLALLHSRRLLHRDIGPRNIRCTPDGRAKLIDFGAMTAMTPGGADVVGTPAFIAPETLHRLALDARTDLYSVGTTLYYALTGQLAYRARTFVDVMAAWNAKVKPPSAFVPEIPAALDDLVLGLMQLEPALRPAGAFEVMQRLSAIAGLQRRESAAVSLAYLATPSLVGRDEELERLRRRLLAARMTEGQGLFIAGPTGVGRSRMLDACVLEGKTLGFTVLRATAHSAREAFSTAHALTRHLLEVSPQTDLGSVADPELDPAQLQRSISRLLLQAARERPLLIAVDDVHRIDQPSAAVLAALIDRARGVHMLVALAADESEASGDALPVLARRCERLDLAPLDRQQTHQLLGSLFGDVANLDMLAGEIYDVALGNPRQCMDMAQHLTDRGLIRYESGAWTLPSRLDAAALPRSAADALRGKVASLSPHARFLAQAQALAFYDTFTDADYRALLSEAGSAAVECALSELLAAQAIVSDGATYALANRLWSEAFLAELDATAIAARHAVLADMYAGRSTIARVHHLHGAGLEEQGLLALEQQHQEFAARIDHKQIIEQNIGKMMWCSARALDTAARVGRSPRAQHDLRRWHLGGLITIEDGTYGELGRVWYQQLIHDSGLDLYWADTTSDSAQTRLMSALTAASQRYLQTPEHERVYTVEEAIRLLAEYVVYCIALGARSHDTALIGALPAALEPFAPLSPVLDAIHNNAIATWEAECECRYEPARERWISVLATLDRATAAELTHVEAIRNAIIFAIGMSEARLGLPTVEQWAARLDHDPYQRISALHLRRIARLEQGDFRGADRVRRQAEVVALQTRSPQMFKSLLTVELETCTAALDLAGVQRVLEQIRPLATKQPGWVAHWLDAEARLHLVRGDFEAAAAGFQAAIDHVASDARGVSSNLAAWIMARAGLAEALLGLERHEQARASSAAALEVCDARGVGAYAFALVRMLALAEAKLGDAAGAAARLERLIARQQELGVAGLRLGLCHEARALVAIWSGDGAAFARYAGLAAREYRYRAHSMLGARYDRLLNEAARHDLEAETKLSDEAGAVFESAALWSELDSMVSRSLMAATEKAERARAVLQLICSARNGGVAHLFLISHDGLEPRCSYGSDELPAALFEHVRDYVARERSRVLQTEDEATACLPEEREAQPHMLQAAGATYELLPLTSVAGGVLKLAGIAAVSCANTEVDSVKQARLLQAIAQHLLESGDSAGIVLAA